MNLEQFVYSITRKYTTDPHLESALSNLLAYFCLYLPELGYNASINHPDVIESSQILENKLAEFVLLETTATSQVFASAAYASIESTVYYYLKEITSDMLEDLISDQETITELNKAGLEWSTILLFVNTYKNHLHNEWLQMKQQSLSE